MKEKTEVRDFLNQRFAHWSWYNNWGQVMIIVMSANFSIMQR